MEDKKLHEKATKVFLISENGFLPSAKETLTTKMAICRELESGSRLKWLFREPGFLS
jgi:hypothetical protein